MSQPTARKSPPATVRIAPEQYDSVVARELIAAVQAEYVIRYGSEDITPVDPAEFAPPAGLFLVAWLDGELDGEPVSCGGWRVNELADGTVAAEIKRMYVPVEHRGRGYARVILAELERTAQAAGLERIVLETGVAQPEAIGLYRSAGYHEIPGFGVYADHPNCRCFAKNLS